jgi:hypothetical protein
MMIMMMMMMMMMVVVMIASCTLKSKGKIRPRTGHEGPDRE